MSLNDEQLYRSYARRTKQKSPVKRFLFIFGVLMFTLYFVLGWMIIFWETMPFDLTQTQRTLFGVLLIVYSFLRFIRLFQAKREE